jgi:glycosyltransferase involved in cell wall biosynthesis
MSAPFLSVIIPNYNHAQFLPTCLEAVLSQSRPADEVIIIDDASTDQSVEVIESFRARYPVLRLIRNPENQGVVFNMNRGLELAQGDYVYFAAADDQVLPGIFEKLLKMVEVHPQAALACGVAEWREVGSGLHWHVGVGMTNEPRFLSPDAMVELERQGKLFIPSIATIFRRASLAAVGNFIPELKWHCDWFAMYLSGFREGICAVPDPLAIAFIHEASYHSVGRRNPEDYREVLLRLMDHLHRPEHREAADRIRRSGALFLFGWPLLKLLLRTPRYRSFLNGTFLRKNLLHITKREAKRFTPPVVADLIFRWAGYRVKPERVSPPAPRAS